MNIFGKIVEENSSNIAFLVGNGINRFEEIKKRNSWNDLMLELCKEFSSDKIHDMLNLESAKNGREGVALTELYDLVELHKSKELTHFALQEKVCTLLGSWIPSDNDRCFVEWARNNKTPVLTTNFDYNLSTAGNCCQFNYAKNRFTTDYYPWEKYFSDHELTDSLSEFAIWHINGMRHH